MVVALARYWWALALRGLIAVLFGITAIFWPAITLEVLVYLYGAFALADGVFAIGATLAGRTGGVPAWALFAEGLCSIGIGLITLFHPAITAVVLLYLIAAWSFGTGILEIVAAIRLRREIEGEWALGLAGVLSILAGVALAAWPAAGLVAIAWIIGVYAVAFGCLLIAFAFRLRDWAARARSRDGQVASSMPSP